MFICCYQCGIWDLDLNFYLMLHQMLTLHFQCQKPSNSSFIALFFGHKEYISRLYENDRFMSHLSNLEREMSFRTEMGMYYSYFKSVVEADSLKNGLNSLVKDNLTEYPTVINALERFNVYPELLLGWIFRAFRSTTEYFKIETSQCYMVNRGKNIPAISNCEGLGEPPLFYVAAIFLLNGLTPAMIFLLSYQLSNSLLIAIMSATSFFYNHGECTRVQWSPPLRENFGFPLLLLQIYFVTKLFRNPRRLHMWLIGVFTLLYILSWQFSQFSLFIHLFSAFICWAFFLLPDQAFYSYLLTLTVSWAIGYVMLFCNEMLPTSIYFPAILSSWILFKAKQHFRFHRHFLISVLVIFSWLALTAISKTAISRILNIEDDAHIMNLFRSKFTEFRDFHTMLYICAAEFDFLPYEYIEHISSTLLLPLSLLGIMLLSIHLLRHIFPFRWFAETDSIDICVLVFHAGIMTGYAIMAALIMRLKLFLTPHICIFVGIIFSSKLALPFFSPTLKFRSLLPYVSNNQLRYALIVGLIAGMSYHGVSNVKHEFSRLGEYSDYAQEQLMLWIIENTNPHDAFLGSMPTMANVKLSTGRPIINHPHYEHVKARTRTKLVYSLFSRRPLTEVYSIISQMNATYAIVEEGWCWAKRRKGCNVYEAFDTEEPQYITRPPTCPLLIRNPHPFKIVFKNAVYVILKI